VGVNEKTPIAIVGTKPAPQTISGFLISFPIKMMLEGIRQLL
jgi:hypothetical protein